MLRGLFTIICLLGASAAVHANGLGEDRPYQFRSATDRQVFLNIERTRLEQDGELGVGGAAGLGTQTGNSLTIDISGSGDNVINVDQANDGDQTIQDADESSSILNN